MKFRHPILSESERVLQDFSAPYNAPEGSAEETKEARKNLRSELLAARKHKTWKDFVNQNYKYTPHTDEGKQKRVERFLMVSSAIDAFDEIPDAPMREGDDPRPGRRFFRNDWFMGPFYSYDHNYLHK